MDHHAAAAFSNLRVRRLAFQYFWVAALAFFRRPSFSFFSPLITLVGDCIYYVCSFSEWVSSLIMSLFQVFNPGMLEFPRYVSPFLVLSAH
jgi:hypothetical protein